MPEPLYYVAPGTGVVSSRSGWGKGDVQFLAKIGAVRESHEERAAGSFALYRGAWLTATAKLGAKSGIDQDVADWNCVTFGTLQQSWTQDQAKLIAQENTDSYTYLAGDLTEAYAPKDVPTVGHYIRTLFYLRPGYLLIRDEFSLVNLTNEPKFRLHTLEQPVVDMTGFVSVSTSAGTKLFGTATAMSTAAVPVRQTPDQVPTWRLDFPADAMGGFCVALEAAPPAQGARTVNIFVPTGLRGAILGKDLAAVVTGNLPVTYKSPVAGTHYLLGLKPNTLYSVGLWDVTTSPAGVLVFSGLNPGTPITISEGNVIPPPPVLIVTGYSVNPVTSGQSFFLNGTGFTSDAQVSWNGMALIPIIVSTTQLQLLAPTVNAVSTAGVIVTQGIRSAIGPNLTVNPVVPVVESYAVSGTVTRQPDNTLTGPITLTKK